MCTYFHNFLRIVHDSPPLKWSDVMEDRSQAWADYLNAIQEMKHRESTTVGSNIYQTSTPEDIDLVCLEAVVFWYNEVKKYDFNKPGYSKETGHFTAMVWSATEIFAVGEEGQADGNFYVVAEYDPRGNMDGGFAENVKELRKVPSSCIDAVANEESYKLLMGELNVDNIQNNKFVYESNETCSVPSRPTKQKEETSPNPGQSKQPSTGQQLGKPGPQGGANSQQAAKNSQKVGVTDAQTGTSAGKETGTTVNLTPLAKTPQQIVIVPISEPMAAANTNPQVVLAAPERSPKTVPKVIVVPEINPQVPAQKISVAPGGSSGVLPTLNTTASSNTTVQPSSISVSSTTFVASRPTSSVKATIQR
ncbi:cell wall protein PRY3-like isoform X2 [Dendronephthya gigantea]|uniref:cell wall protein PRY3-like isoform X2 n=1 Tax=Dendronephthya gigantea TaxID=151771 RepID=UPI00106C73A4|nr:cell wall protein PRY3-like isoform X2 [Dendronephthya gigantea]